MSSTEPLTAEEEQELRDAVSGPWGSPLHPIARLLATLDAERAAHRETQEASDLWRDEWRKAVEAKNIAEARVQRLKEALRPFAALVNEASEDWEDDNEVLLQSGSAVVRWSNFEKALAALAATAQEE